MIYSYGNIKMIILKEESNFRIIKGCGNEGKNQENAVYRVKQSG